MDHNQSNIFQMAQQHALRTSVAHDAMEPTGMWRNPIKLFELFTIYFLSYFKHQIVI